MSPCTLELDSERRSFSAYAVQQRGIFEGLRPPCDTGNGTSPEKLVSWRSLGSSARNYAGFRIRNSWIQGPTNPSRGTCSTCGFLSRLSLDEGALR